MRELKRACVSLSMKLRVIVDIVCCYYSLIHDSINGPRFNIKIKEQYIVY